MQPSIRVCSQAETDLTALLEGDTSQLHFTRVIVYLLTCICSLTISLGGKGWQL